MKKTVFAAALFAIVFSCFISVQAQDYVHFIKEKLVPEGAQVIAMRFNISSPTIDTLALLLFGEEKETGRIYLVGFHTTIKGSDGTSQITTNNAWMFPKAVFSKFYLHTYFSLENITSGMARMYVKILEIISSENKTIDLAN